MQELAAGAAVAITVFGTPFILANVKWLLSIYALEKLNLLTLLFPATTTAVNTALISVVLVRRSQPHAHAEAVGHRP